MRSSTKWLIGEVAATLIAMALLGAFQFPLLLSYNWHKTLHILGGVIFLGNIIVTGVWMVLAERTGDASVIRFAVRTVNWADVFFTAPGVFLLIANGMVLVTALGGLLKTGWAAAGLGLFTLSGIVWVAFLIPQQNALIKLTGVSAGALSADVYRVLRRWYAWGIVATVLPLVSLVLMVLKPKLW